MTLEFEKLSDAVEQMGETTLARQRQLAEKSAELLAKLEKYATDHDTVHDRVTRAREKADEKWFRAARPLFAHERLNEGIAPPEPPDRATIIAVDGSQILPDRHASYLYYLLNVGAIVYHHGSGVAPDTFSYPTLEFPQDDLDASTDLFTSSAVSIERDLAEIGTLAKTAWEQRYAAAPVIALMDQRLLYWPIGSQGQQTAIALDKWLESMTKIRDSNALLAGYIDRPGTQTVINTLYALDIDEPGFDVGTLSQQRQGIQDIDLYKKLLKPGERSAIFVNDSLRNSDFEAKGQAVAFFYFNPTRNSNRLARVDVPVWAAQQPEAVDQIHGLLYHQCQLLLSDYPYVITRADELARVSHREQEMMDMKIDLTMQRLNISSDQTSKQLTKNIARASRSRFSLR